MYGGVCFRHTFDRKGVRRARYDETLVVRCSGKLKRTVDQWAKRHDKKPGEVAIIQAYADWVWQLMPKDEQQTAFRFELSTHGQSAGNGIPPYIHPTTDLTQEHSCLSHNKKLRPPNSWSLKDTRKISKRS